MGERLNFEIANGCKVIANCYYHWSGYTIRAIEHASVISHNYLAMKNKYENPLYRAVALFELTGAGVSQHSLEAFRCELPQELIVKARDRNYGLIGISAKDIRETQQNGEEGLEFNLETETFDLYGCFIPVCKSNADWFKDCEIVDIDYDLGEVSLDDFEKVAEIIRDADNKGYLIKDHLNNVFATIG